KRADENRARKHERVAQLSKTPTTRGEVHESRGSHDGKDEPGRVRLHVAVEIRSFAIAAESSQWPMQYSAERPGGEPDPDGRAGMMRRCQKKFGELAEIAVPPMAELFDEWREKHHRGSDEPQPRRNDTRPQGGQSRASNNKCGDGTERREDDCEV